MTVVDNIKSETINAVAKKNIQEGSTIKSDDFKSYRGLKNEGYKRSAVVMKVEGNDSALLWLHTIIFNAKSYILGTYHGLDRMHLQRYLDEFCYRFNRRFFETELFDRLLFACTVGKTVTYQNLIIRKPKPGNNKKVKTSPYFRD
jgi:transposase-like protein